MDKQTGVVGMRCAICGKWFGIVNAAQYARDVKAGVVYFCSDCMQLPEEVVVARLVGAVHGAPATVRSADCALRGEVTA